MTPRLLEELVSGRPNQRLTFQIGNPKIVTNYLRIDRMLCYFNVSRCENRSKRGCVNYSCNQITYVIQTAGSISFVWTQERYHKSTHPSGNSHVISKNSQYTLEHVCS